MPELPEVETVRRGLAPHMLGQAIQSVHIARYDLRRPIPVDLGQRLTSRVVTHLSRRGKLMMWHLDNSNVVMVHLGMSGRCAVVENATYEAEKHDHVRVVLASGDAVIFNDPRRFGYFDICAADELENDPLLSKLGPEPLSDDFTADVLAEALSRKTGPIKTVLLDQTVVAGLGNIYVCEALFKSGISPSCAANAISSRKIKDLAVAIRAVLLRAVEVGGSTLKDHRKPDGDTGYFQIEFSVYDKEGSSCPVNPKHTIQRLVQSGRSTFYCPACQK